jgi:hypothetical protein
MNSIKTSPDLVFVDYSDLLNKILYVISQQGKEQIFRISETGDRLLINIDRIATQVAQLQIDDPLSSSEKIARSATINISPGSKETFNQQIQQIRNHLQKSLKLSLKNHISLEDFVTHLTTDLEDFKSHKESLDLSYSFKSYEGLSKQRLSFVNQDINENNENKSSSLLKFHKLTISVEKTTDFQKQLRQSLEHYLKVYFTGASFQEKEDLKYILEDLENDKNSDFYQLQNIVDTETLGKLKKQAQINYLEFLLENIQIENNPLKVEGSIYLQDLIRRLKSIETY